MERVRRTPRHSSSEDQTNWRRSFDRSKRTRRAGLINYLEAGWRGSCAAAAPRRACRRARRRDEAPDGRHRRRARSGYEHRLHGTRSDHTHSLINPGFLIYRGRSTSKSEEIRKGGVVAVPTWSLFCCFLAAFDRLLLEERERFRSLSTWVLP